MFLKDFDPIEDTFRKGEKEHHSYTIIKILCESRYPYFREGKLNCPSDWDEKARRDYVDSAQRDKKELQGKEYYDLVGYYLLFEAFEHDRLKSEIDRLNAEIKKLRDPDQKSFSETSRARDSALKMLITMGVLCGYTPKRNGVAKKVSDKALSLGIKISDDTVKDWLKEASELLSKNTLDSLG